ncbi:MAG: hypothetical protein FJX76_09805 [Armatimonadetes bacterium]|nr:hypothetical protein [Armatimonadota bacterium]
MMELSAGDVARVVRKVKDLLRANNRFREDLRHARRLLMRALVKREGDSENVRGIYSRRAAQYALLLIRSLEASAERKKAFYSDLARDPKSLYGKPVARVLECRAATVHRLTPTFLSWHNRLLHTIAAWVGPDPATTFRDWLRRHHFFTSRAEVQVLRALQVGEAFERLAARTGGAEWELERVRQELIRGAGTQFDPLMVEALVTAWSEIVAFHGFRRLAA